jgi:hypothetical protein
VAGLHRMEGGTVTLLRRLAPIAAGVVLALLVVRIFGEHFAAGFAFGSLLGALLVLSSGLTS